MVNLLAILDDRDFGATDFRPWSLTQAVCWEHQLHLELCTEVRDYWPLDLTDLSTGPCTLFLLHCRVGLLRRDLVFVHLAQKQARCR